MPVTVALYEYADRSRCLLTRWTLTDIERRLVAAGQDIYVGQMNFGGPMTPLIVQCGPGEFRVPDQTPTGA